MLPLTRTERAVWLRFLAYETRMDSVGARAQMVLRSELDKALHKPWCDCPYHNDALVGVLAILWRKRPE